jgi:hypothetical protein
MRAVVEKREIYDEGDKYSSSRKARISAEIELNDA